MSESYVVGYTLFPQGYRTFKTRFQVFNDKKSALHFYKGLLTKNKAFYRSVDEDEVMEMIDDDEQRRYKGLD